MGRRTLSEGLCGQFNALNEPKSHSQQPTRSRSIGGATKTRIPDAQQWPNTGPKVDIQVSNRSERERRDETKGGVDMEARGEIL